MNDQFVININDSNQRLRSGILKSNLPLFAVNDSDLTVIDSPQDFYSELLDIIKLAETRIVIASLYIGHESTEIVDLIRQQLRKKSALQVWVVVDFFRGQRRARDVGPNAPGSTVELLQPLIREFGPARVHVGLYHSPKATWLKKKILPQRYDEILGLNHVKVYAADDSLLLSGANLNSDYYENRQDRYIKISSGNVAQFYSTFVERLYSLSFRVDGALRVAEPPEMKRFGRDGKPWSKSWATYSAKVLRELFDEARPSPEARKAFSECDSNGRKVWLVPVVQSGALGLHSEQDMLASLLDYNVAYNLCISSGYLNFPTWLSELLRQRIEHNSGSLTLVTASPEANCFHNSKGLSKFIPLAYSYLEARILAKFKHGAPVTCYEYNRRDWSFHAKGIWMTDCSDNSLHLCTIGSSNFGYRSMTRDLELDTLILPDSLKAQACLMNHASSHLLKYSNPTPLVDLYKPNRRAPLWVKCIVKTMKTFW